MKITVVYELDPDFEDEAATFFVNDVLAEKGFDDEVMGRMGLDRNDLIDKIKQDPEFISTLEHEVTRSFIIEGHDNPWDFGWPNELISHYPTEDNWLTPIISEASDVWDAIDAENELLRETRAAMIRHADKDKYEKMKRELQDNGYVVYEKNPKKKKAKKKP